MTKSRTKPVDLTQSISSSWREDAWSNRSTSLFLISLGLEKIPQFLERAAVANVSWTSLRNALVVIQQPMPWGIALINGLREGGTIDIMASYTGWPRDDYVAGLVIARFANIREIAFETSQLVAAGPDEEAVITVGVAFGCRLEFIVQEDEDE